MSVARVTPGRTEEAASGVCLTGAHLLTRNPRRSGSSERGEQEDGSGGPGNREIVGHSLGLGCGGEETGKLLVTWNLRIRERWCVLLVFCSCESKIGLACILCQVAP